MLNLKQLKTIKRVTLFRNRDQINGLRLDSNEMVNNWPKKHFKKIYSKINNFEVTSYPENNYYKLKKLITNNLKIKLTNFIITSGADGAIREFFYLNSFNKKNKVLILGEGYGMYDVYFKIFNYKVCKINYYKNINKSTFCKINKIKFYKELNKNDIIVLINPNHLSNFEFSYKEIIGLLKKFPRKKFFIDEAYYGYGCFSVVNLVRKFKNIFVARSFSKHFGLASIRLGCLISNSKNILIYEKIAQPYITNIYSAKIAEYFLENYHLIEKKLRNEINGREYFVKKITKDIKDIRIHSSNSMSVFLKFKNKKERNYIYKGLLKTKIYTRIWDISFKDEIFYCLRITCAPKKIMYKLYSQLFILKNALRSN